MSYRLSEKFAGLVCAGLLFGTVLPVLAADEMPADEKASAADDVMPPDSEKERPWAATLYTVWLSGDQLGDMLVFKAELEDDQLWVAALSRKLASVTRSLDFEVEGQIGKHAGPLQRHWEFNVLGTLRWTRFPWNNYVDTTGAIGLGVSYAQDVPAFEIEHHEKSNKTLAYILVEMTAALPSHPQWALVTRIHHRSSAYGLFESDIQGASNAFGVGIKYRF